MKTKKTVSASNTDNPKPLTAEANDSDNIGRQRSAGTVRTKPIKDMLAEKSRDDLQTILLDLTRDIPSVRRRLEAMTLPQIKNAPTGGDPLIGKLKQKIKNLDSRDWPTDWNDDTDESAYDPIERLLKKLLATGNADAVVALGEDLWKKTLQLIDDDSNLNELEIDAVPCLELILLALQHSSLTIPEQIIWRIEHQMSDTYGLLGSDEDILNDARYTIWAWLEVSTALEQRFASLDKKSATEKTSDVRRPLLYWLGHAYTRGGEQHKLIPLLKQEADRCTCHAELVDKLIEAGEYDDARCWCRHAIKYLGPTDHTLERFRAKLHLLAEKQHQFDLVAAYQAETFFATPSIKGYADLQRAADKIGLWPIVREHVLTFAKTGLIPVAENKGHTTWPLPQTETKQPDQKSPRGRSDKPNTNLLIEIAILEGRNEDVVVLYQQMTKIYHRFCYAQIDLKVADFVAKSHPDIALKIWQSHVERLIAEVKPSAYQAAKPHLLHMRQVYKTTGRQKEWMAFLLELRVKHKAKHRLMDVLDELEAKRL